MLLESKIKERLQSRTPQDSASAVAAYYSEYINDVLTAVEAFELNILGHWKRQKIQQAIFDVFPQFQMEVNNEVGKIRIRHLRRSQQFSVALEPSSKERIRHYLTKVREVIDGLDVNQAKKEALYARVDALAEEVDRDRTRFEAVSALLVEAASTVGAVASKLEPVRKWVETIAGVLGSAKEQENKLGQLPAPPILKQLEPPEQTSGQADSQQRKKGRKVRGSPSGSSTKGQ